MKNVLRTILIVSFILINYSTYPQKMDHFDVLIIGGGASGTTAGIQAASMGAKTLIVEESPWLGGMLTAAGVSAVDGNYRLHSGLWEEFRQALNAYYGGENNLKTGWVSNVLFEPHIGEQILTNMCKKESNLSVWRMSKINEIDQIQNNWLVHVVKDNEIISVTSKIVIDATELGDILKKVGISYDIGMDSKKITGEEIAPLSENDVVQDLTYVAVLKDYGPNADMTIEKPTNYNPEPFKCTCKGKCTKEESGNALWDCDKMMEYGKLPNGYYMINWPIYGNDYYTNLLELNAEERLLEIEKAKNYTLQYVYYLQTELGFKNLGIAKDVYPTDDGLPLIPYHRESRRMHGIVSFNINDLARPFEQKTALYRTGIAVGDYPVDHHHNAHPQSKSLPDLHFYPVPSYSLPIGSLIPKNKNNFIVAEKSISVSNIVNGTTRLQPVCLLIGQAAGTLAALSVKENKSPEEVSIRSVQTELIKSGAFIMPYSDIDVNHFAFQSLQRIGATGILKGEGKNIGWENHTHIYPENPMLSKDLIDGLRNWELENNVSFQNDKPTYKELVQLFKFMLLRYGSKKSSSEIKKRIQLLCSRHNFYLNKQDASITRAQFALLLDSIVNPFQLRDVDHFGNFK